MSTSLDSDQDSDSLTRIWDTALGTLKDPTSQELQGYTSSLPDNSTFILHNNGSTLQQHWKNLRDILTWNYCVMLSAAPFGSVSDLHSEKFGNCVGALERRSFPRPSPPPTHQRSSTLRIIDTEEGRATIPSCTISEPQQAGRSNTSRSQLMADRFLRRGKRKVGVVDSLKAIAFSSWLNLLLVSIPIAWVAHFTIPNGDLNTWNASAFLFSFVSLIPLSKLFDYGGEQMAFYLGPDLGDLLIITLNNAVEATLGIILLTRCELKLLQSNIMGVVLLRLLLVPGVAFITGGVRVLEQDLHPHQTQLNQTLLTIGVMTLLIPAAFFAALDNGVAGTAGADLLSDTMRGKFLKMSRGLALILIAVYICSRIFLQKPPGHSNLEIADRRVAPEVLRDPVPELDSEEPQVSQWVCIGMLIITIGIMAATAEWLVDNIEVVEEIFTKEWFGLVLLPLASFSGDAFVAIVFFVRKSIESARGQSTPPTRLANGRPIDLSIQYTLFWMPFIVLLGWWSDRPMSLLFDMFEVALVISSCFIVNYVTADAKTNYVEGFSMSAFYVMIVLCSWFYTGQDGINYMLACGSVENAVAAGDN
ncbi:Vacuolar calcium ion transporter [Mycena venus]|uniref:Vacuolar calcium ion transporter n=1 Tax=Mycena venus TaxID=2733690 RepID=A0A8H7CMK9_9AGAR|nr:Vacuolar calcium ion transporter [Mycena venus]